MSASSNTLRRLMMELKQMNEKPVAEFSAQPLPSNILEWHFTLAGPPDTPYSEGYYHGRLFIPSEYPFAPPDVVLITPNGRFELEKKICLSISSYHPENWRPAWGLATVLHGLRQFMATPGNNAIGAIEYPKEKRLQLAQASRTFVCPHCGVCVVKEIEQLKTRQATGAQDIPSLPPATPPQNPTTPPTHPGGGASALDLSVSSTPKQQQAQVGSAPPLREGSTPTTTPAGCPSKSPLIPSSSNLGSSSNSSTPHSRNNNNNINTSSTSVSSARQHPMMMMAGTFSLPPPAVSSDVQPQQQQQQKESTTDIIREGDGDAIPVLKGRTCTSATATTRRDDAVVPPSPPLAAPLPNKNNKSGSSADAAHHHREEERAVADNDDATAAQQREVNQPIVPDPQRPPPPHAAEVMPPPPPPPPRRVRLDAREAKLHVHVTVAGIDRAMMVLLFVIALIIAKKYLVGV